jgi:hypothetical protein
MSLRNLAFVGLVMVALVAPLGEVWAATYYVGSISELTTRINLAVAGDEIVVSNGVYTTSASIGISRVGTASNPIIIRAATVGGVEIKGTHGFNLNSGASYIVIQGFKLTHAAAMGMSSGASHCRVTRNIIELNIPTGTDVSYINVNGNDQEIDHNELRNKSTLGEMLDITGSGSQVARRLWVHHNYFHDFVSPGGNGAETIRWGLSGLSLSTGEGVCEYNLFVKCDGENEMISNKSSGNTYRYNTVLDCPGGEISQRHGNDCLYYGNYMRNTQGIRVYGDRHRIFSNYLESNSVGVNMGNGDGDVYNGAALTAHDRPDDNVVVFNTFVNNSTHYEMGGRTGGLGSSNTVVANNIFQGGGSMASISSSAPYTGTWSNNVRWQTSSAGNMPSSGYMAVNPLLVKDASGAYHVQAGSPAINAGVGSYDYYGNYSPYSYVNVDMDGQARDGSKDIGADEFSAAPAPVHILSTNEVGPYAGAGLKLTITPATRRVPPNVQTNASYTIEVTDFSGLNASVALSVSGLPAGTSGSFIPSAVSGSGTATMNVSVSNGVSMGNYVFTVTGKTATTTNSAMATLSVTTNLDGALVARLNFDDGTAADSSGNGNDGTLRNGAAIVSDSERGQVLLLDGVDDYVELGNGGSLDLSGVNQATVAAWIKIAVSHNHNAILSKGEWKEAYSLVVKGDTTPKDQLWTGNDVSVFSGSAIPLNAWTHVAVTINGDLTTFYINGQVAGGVHQDRGEAIDNTTTAVCIGREQYSGSLPAGRWFFNGRMDDVRIYGRELTQGEIQTAMAGAEVGEVRIEEYTLLGTNLILSGRSDFRGGQYYVLASTNVTLEATNWKRTGTSEFGLDGRFIYSNAVDNNAPQTYYRLQLQ